VRFVVDGAAGGRAGVDFMKPFWPKVTNLAFLNDLIWSNTGL
jgi:hypothetical protein